MDNILAIFRTLQLKRTVYHRDLLKLFTTTNIKKSDGCYLFQLFYNGIRGVRNDLNYHINRRKGEV